MLASGWARWSSVQDSLYQYDMNIMVYEYSWHDVTAMM